MTESYAIQILSKDNDFRSPLIYGDMKSLSETINTLLELDPKDGRVCHLDDYVLVVLENDEHGNELSSFSFRPLLFVETFLKIAKGK